MRSAHPADGDLDRLRAGLIEVSSSEYERLRAHVETCARCQGRSRAWTHVTEALDAGAREPALAARLRGRRQRALRGEGATTSRRPRTAVAVFATFVVATLAVGLGTWSYLARDPGDLRIASAPGRDNVPDLYADIDFYLWLLKREAANEAPNG